MGTHPASQARLLRRALDIGVAGLLVVVLAAAVLIPAAGAQSACGAISGSWTSIPAPDFPAGERAITDYAVDPIDVNRFLATNGTVVMSSLDGGCSWRNAYSRADPGADQPFSSDTARRSPWRSGEVATTVTPGSASPSIDSSLPEIVPV